MPGSIDSFVSCCCVFSTAACSLDIHFDPGAPVVPKVPLSSSMRDSHCGHIVGVDAWGSNKSNMCQFHCWHDNRGSSLAPDISIPCVT